MTRLLILILLLLFTSAPAAGNDFGIHMIGQAVAVTIERHVSASIGLASIRSVAIGNVRDAARVAAHFGHITSTWRSVEHNRAVGGVPNSYHLRDARSTSCGAATCRIGKSRRRCARPASI